MTEAPLKGKASGGAAVTDTTLATYDAQASRYAARYEARFSARCCFCWVEACPGSAR